MPGSQGQIHILPTLGTLEVQSYPPTTYQSTLSPRPLSSSLRSSTGNPAFPPGGSPHPIPQPQYPECQPSVPHPLLHSPLAPGMPPMNPLAPDMVGPGVIVDKKIQKKMKKAHKKMYKHYKHHKHGKHYSFPSISSSSSDSEYRTSCRPGN
uniref:Uncharacterized protein n=1 Tax=Piliocolobus tephrosceles TaxID=591936 RepID=A0A8C9LZ70_9PRIM